MLSTQLSAKCPTFGKYLVTAQNMVCTHDTNDTNDVCEAHKFFGVKGHVQSGKTLFMTCATLHYHVTHRRHVAIVLRDKCADRDQYIDRLSRLAVEMGIDNLRITKNTSLLSIAHTEDPQIVVCLSNVKRLRQMRQFFSRSTVPFVLILDEADFVDSCHHAKKIEEIEWFKQKSLVTFGVSATLLDTVNRETIAEDQILLLDTTPTYRGFLSLQFVEMDASSKFSGSVKAVISELDPHLDAFVADFIKQPVQDIPHMCLINVCRTKQPCVEAQNHLCDTFPTLTTIVYNGDGVRFRKGEQISEVKMTLSTFLQFLKESGGVNEYPHILIFSGDLAARGISFVSSDHQWHLTSMRLTVANSCDEPELLQKLRLCGVYSDTHPLTLYTTAAIYADLKRAFMRQEELLLRLKTDGELPHELHIDKQSKRKICKDPSYTIEYYDNHSGDVKSDEWDTYSEDELPPDLFYSSYGLEAPTTSDRRTFGQMMRSHATEFVHKPEQSSSKRRKTVTQHNALGGKYYIIDPEELSGPVSKQIATHALSQMIERNVCGVPVSRVDINKWLLDMNNPLFKNMNQLNGIWLNTIQRHMCTTDNAQTAGLLYWTDDPVDSKNKHYFLQLNL